MLYELPNMEQLLKKMDCKYFYNTFIHVKCLISEPCIGPE